MVVEKILFNPATAVQLPDKFLFKTKIEDAFIDHYLTKDGETVEEAKARLKGEHNT